MEKRKEKSDLEQLLNSLIEKGWKPFGRNSNKAYYRPEGPDEFYFGENGYGYIYNWRQVVSKESGLWQFVCENGMIKKEGNSEWTIIYPNERAGDYQKCHSYCEGQSEYWILESALCDEDKLEDFLLNSIKLD